MKKTAILIDATNQTITQVEVEDFKCIQRHIGCDVFTTAQEFPEGHTLWVDDGGWTPKQDAPKRMFRLAPEGVVYDFLEFAGNGILTRVDEGGETIDVLPKSLRFLNEIVQFEDEEITDEKRAQKLGDGFTMIEIEEGK